MSSGEWGKFEEKTEKRRLDLTVRSVDVFRVLEERRMKDERHTGLIKDDRFPCGYRFDPWTCQMMADCQKFGDFEKCRTLEETVNE